MRNIKCFPFCRNQYFFGKLLTVADFETEQQYFNDKRRVLNRLLFGMGVVCGLTVTRVDGNTIVVDPGFALDYLGREIVVEQAVLKKLSAIDGFLSENNTDLPVFLCIEYDEYEHEPVHNIANQHETKHNKVIEGYRFCVVYEENPQLATPDESLDEIFDKRPERIYLAKLTIVRFEDTYEIEEVENLPFGQRIVIPYKNAVHNQEENPPDDQQEQPQNVEPPPPPPTGYIHNPGVATGVVKVVPPDDAKQGDVFYSEEFSHGLGCVNAFVEVGLSNHEQTVYGSGGIFPGSNGFDHAVRINSETGMFQIGIRLNKEPPSSIDFRWVAYKAEEPTAVEEIPKELQIKPNITRIRVRTSQEFVAFANGEREFDVVWSVRDRNGGVIDNRGRYIAPDRTGVFEVSAHRSNDPTLSGTAFVVVVDK